MDLSLYHRHGVQGNYDTASHSELDNEFDTHTDEDVIKSILEKGTLQESEVSFFTFFQHAGVRARKHEKDADETANRKNRCRSAKAPRMTPRALGLPTSEGSGAWPTARDCCMANLGRSGSIGRH